MSELALSDPALLQAIAAGRAAAKKAMDLAQEAVNAADESFRMLDVLDDLATRAQERARAAQDAELELALERSLEQVAFRDLGEQYREARVL